MAGIAAVISRDVEFGIQIGKDLPQMGQIGDLFRSDSVHLGASRIRYVLKIPRFVPFGADLTQFGCQIRHP